jgi:two-component system response regulator YesN
MVELYKLILVDDEDEIRGRIASMITEDTGFEVVANASNGYDALELIEKHNPHAVITDIRMPYIDGIALAQEIRNDFSQVKVAFLTGFGEFN